MRDRASHAVRKDEEGLERVMDVEKDGIQPCKCGDGAMVE